MGNKADSDNIFESNFFSKRAYGDNGLEYKMVDEMLEDIDINTSASREKVEITEELLKAILYLFWEFVKVKLMSHVVKINLPYLGYFKVIPTKIKTKGYSGDTYMDGNDERLKL